MPKRRSMLPACRAAGGGPTRHSGVVGRMRIVALFSNFGVLALCGCSKVTAENYDRLRLGMAFEEVAGFLGSPDQCAEKMGFKNCRWGDDASHIRVNFVADKVAVFTSKNVR